MNLRKKIVFAVFALTVGIGSAVTAGASSAVSANDPCVDCYNTWWDCVVANPGYEDWCEVRYYRCLYNNGCPV